MKRIAVFARHTAPGRVKTRLSPALPAPLACDLYRAMLADALDGASGAKAEERWVFWAGEGPAEADAGFHSESQRGEDLGARLGDAFARMLGEPHDRAVVVGSDCPGLTSALVDEAFAALEHCDAVFGPARDGGYYLVALRSPTPALFEGIAWGSARVLEQTRRRAEEHGVSLALLRELPDLDTPDDLVRAVVGFALEGGGGREPAVGVHTRAALAAMGFLPDEARRSR
jgi:rSAM/selenodomain-associated transferase 1